VYCISSELLQGYSGCVVLILEGYERLLVQPPVSFGQASTSIHLDFLGMEDFEARIIALEFLSLWAVGIYAPATGDEV
jgi:hypothetical protein